jgi:two-component system, OmpR family, copper resistance phosphate regulon response regulator CusR
MEVAVVRISSVRILVVEDEKKVAAALRDGLMAERHDVVVEVTGEGAYFRLDTESFDFVLLDLALPGRDGLQILSSIRGRGIRTPVLVVTARDTVADRVSGLDAGADDYLVKPFAFAELLARVRAIMRRGASESLQLAVCDLTVDLLARRVVRAGRLMELTAREFDLLVYLLQRDGQVVTRESLARDIWKETSRCTPLNNVIDVHVARLRKKVDADQPVKLIHTVRGVGYMVCEEQP